MNNGIDSVRRAMDEYINKEDLQQIIDQLITKADKDTLSKVAHTVEEDCVKKEEFKEHQEETEYKIDEIHDKLETKTENSEFKHIQKLIAKKIEDNFAKTSLIKDCHKDKNELQKQLNKLQSEVEKIKKYCRKLEDKVSQNERALDTKVELEEMDEIRELVV